MKRSYSDRIEEEAIKTNKRAKMDFSLAAIPHDLYTAIASFMDDQTKRQMRLANTEWFNIIKYNNFALFLTKDEDLPNIVERLSNYSWSIELNLQKHKLISFDTLIQNISKLTNLTRLHDTGPRRDIEVNPDLLLKLTTLTNMVEWKAPQYIPPIEVVKKWTKLSNWLIPNGTESEIGPILQRMQNLNAAYLDLEQASLLNYLGYPKRLTRLRVGGRKEHQQVDLSHLTALENLEWMNATVPVLDSATNLTRLMVLRDDWSQQSAESLTKLKKLKSLRINPRICEQFNLWPGLSHIRTLSFLNDPYGDLSLSNMTCLVNLQELEVLRDGSILPHLSNLTSLDVQPLKSDAIRPYICILTKLDSLTIYCTSNNIFDPDVLNLDLSNLTRLTGLAINATAMTMDTFNSIAYLTNLNSLIVQTGQISNSNFLADLTNLTLLATPISFDLIRHSTILTRLTNIQSLHLSLHGDDNRILDLTVLNNLTELQIHRAPQRFTGIHLTALTSLQMLVLNGDKPEFMYGDNELVKRMPSLYYQLMTLY